MSMRSLRRANVGLGCMAAARPHAPLRFSLHITIRISVALPAIMLPGLAQFFFPSSTSSSRSLAFPADAARGLLGGCFHSSLAAGGEKIGGGRELVCARALPTTIIITACNAHSHHSYECYHNVLVCALRAQRRRQIRCSPAHNCGFYVGGLGPNTVHRSELCSVRPRLDALPRDTKPCCPVISSTQCLPFRSSPRELPHAGR